MKDKTIRVGSRWFNPDHIAMAELTAAAPLAVKLTIAGAPTAWEFTGDEAEAVMEALGHGAKEREKEAKEKAAAQKKAVEEAEKEQQRQAKEAEKEAAKAAGHPAHAPAAGHTAAHAGAKH